MNFFSSFNDFRLLAACQKTKRKSRKINWRRRKCKKKPARIFDGKFFTVVKSERGNIVATCTICGEMKKGNLSSTGNFKSHFKKNMQRNWRNWTTIWKVHQMSKLTSLDCPLLSSHAILILYVLCKCTHNVSNSMNTSID